MLKKSYNLSLVWMSLLNGYAFVFFRGFSLAMMVTAILSLLFVYISLTDKEYTINNSPPLLVFCLFFTITIFSVYVNSSFDISGIAYKLIKIFSWACYISIGGFYFFDFELFIKYSRHMIYITFFYLCIQCIMHLVGINIPNSFNLGIIVPNSSAYEYIISYESAFRPGSLWQEPAYLGYIYNAYLSVFLFGTISILSKKEKIIILICLLSGIVISASTGAIGILGLQLLCYVLSGRSKKIKIIPIATVFGGVFYFLTNTNLMERYYGINKAIDNSIYKLMHLDNSSRVGNSFELINKLSKSQKFLGTGVGNEITLLGNVYMNSITTIIVWCGWIGLIFWAFIWVMCYRKICTTTLQKMLLIIYLLDCVFSGMIFSAISYIYLVIILYYDFFDNTDLNDNTLCP